MSLISLIKRIIGIEQKNEKPVINTPTAEIYKENEEMEIQIVSIWDVLNIQEHTQAKHLVSVIPYDEWVSMDEIRRRIWDIFQIEYKNDRSLYPYLKTMVDLWLIETSNIGGRRKWRKRDLLIKKSEKKKKTEEIEQKIALNQ